jgi:galactokinase
MIASMMNLNLLRHEFFKLGGHSINQPEIYFAPGRVNLIGEHTDYNGGLVLPCALQYGTYLLIRETGDGLIRLYSRNFPETLVLPAGQPLKKQKVQWFNYPLGVMKQFADKGIRMPSMELYFAGDIPNSAGLSSSASIEMVTAAALNDLLKAGFAMTDLIRMSQKAEHEFAGVQCGIMDQFAVGMAEKNHAVFLNCLTLEYKLVPVLLPGYRVVIANSNKARGLAGSKYNERVGECRKAVKALEPVFGAKHLGEIGFMQFYKVQDRIRDEVIRKRARHVISENQRVLNSVSCLLKSDLVQFGALMNSSHDSLRDNYEVTGPELDALAEEALKVRGVLGARMTGAGFGGCTVNLVTEDAVDPMIEQVEKAYRERTGLNADFYIAEISDGVRKVIL